MPDRIANFNETEIRAILNDDLVRARDGRVLGYMVLFKPEHRNVSCANVS